MLTPGSGVGAPPPRLRLVPPTPPAVTPQFDPHRLEGSGLPPAAPESCAKNTSLTLIKLRGRCLQGLMQVWKLMAPPHP